MEPLLLHCVVCAGKDEKCKTCGGSGRERIESCPHEMISLDVWELLKMSTFARRGILPCAGGLLDQTKIFVDACDRVWAEEGFWRSKLGIFNTEE
jgi:hypothetical protein